MGKDTDGLLLEIDRTLDAQRDVQLDQVLAVLFSGYEDEEPDSRPGYDQCGYTKSTRVGFAGSPHAPDREVDRPPDRLDTMHYPINPVQTPSWMTPTRPLPCPCDAGAIPRMDPPLRRDDRRLTFMYQHTSMSQTLSAAYRDGLMGARPEYEHSRTRAAYRMGVEHANLISWQ